MRQGMIAGLLGLALLAAVGAAADEFKTLFDGKDASRWMTNNGKPVPAANVQEDGLNPHKSGGYIVMYDQKFKDFVLDFDYKISQGCNSGVFLRVGNPKDPVNTGIEVAIDDTKGQGMHDPGAFYDLVAPRVNAQKPAGAWNHMTITARGPKITVELNGQEVNTIDLSQFTEPGQRPDGSRHKFRNVAIKDLDQPGYLGFQDHGQDCWFKNVKIKVLD
ncbi:MAG: DUF1080 domain-containing protein [Isosphaeraceae bacterium]|nr:DUF1080 domain-containing protein [Isosphaeraceae bacterium]